MTRSMALLLTEGAVADITKGGDYKLFGFYVQTPLTWGLHVRNDVEKFQSTDDLKNATFGISRFTSGSHLMSYVMASQKG
mmetsp:Transcript_20025/g.46793  ORF Transcript_20025/g.46793 Transcript_20025/m.46793 type:complete len:80 (+) Transcript_20025:175-414(+)